MKNSKKNEETQISNNNSSVVFLNNQSKRKSLVDETESNIQIMKIGDNFKIIKKNKGKSVFISLSPNEDKLILSYKRCFCKKVRTIHLEKISICETGHPYHYYYQKKYENYFSIILTNNKYYEFFNPVENTSKKWVNSINYLLHKKKKHTNASNNNNVLLDKEAISDIWQTEIIPNWPKYRKYILDKNKEKYFTNLSKSRNNKMDKSLDKNENIEILKLNNEEVLYLWSLGLPGWLRKNLWNIVIRNELEITKLLFQGLTEAKIIENIKAQDFQASTVSYRISKSTLCSSVISGYEDNKNNLERDINNDIELYYSRNEDIISAEKKNNYKKEIYEVIRSFYFFRSDILYTKEIVEISSFLYLNSDNYYDTFRILCNLVIPSFLFDYLQNNIEKTKNYYDFFEMLMMKYINFLYNYFRSINFPIDKVFHKWSKYLFLKTFNYNISQKIFDNFIIRGKIYIFQVALAILLIKQKDILNSDFNNLRLSLKKNKLDIEENILFSEIEKLDIRKEYNEFFDIYALGKEKIDLFQDL